MQIGLEIPLKYEKEDFVYCLFVFNFIDIYLISNVVLISAV